MCDGTVPMWSDGPVVRKAWDSQCSLYYAIIIQQRSTILDHIPLSSTYSCCSNFSSLNLDKLSTDLTHLPSHYIPPDRMKKWEDLIRKLMESATAGLTVATRPLPQLASLTTSHTPAAETPSGTSSSSLLPPSIRKLVDKSNERPAVSVCHCA